jgi:hypothetical protein
MSRLFAPGFTQDDDLAGLPLFVAGGAPAPPASPPAVVHIPPQDPKVRGTEEEPRLTRQSLAILARLREGPASNSDLVLIAQRFGARVHDLREAGYPITILSRDRASGVTVYALEEP